MSTYGPAARQQLHLAVDRQQAELLKIRAARAHLTLTDYILQQVERAEMQTAAAPGPSREEFYRAERPVDVLAWMETRPEPGEAFTDSEGRLWVYPGRGRPPEQDRLASPAENAAGIAACREVLKNAKGPLAKDLRSLLR